MPALSSFDYAIIRVVPFVDRDERINAGVIVYCRARDFLAARTHLEPGRALALAPGVDVGEIGARLSAIELIGRGGDAAGPIGKLSQSERFQWLVSPRSTIIQTSVAHCGLTDDPQRELDRLFEQLVLPRLRAE